VLEKGLLSRYVLNCGVSQHFILTLAIAANTSDLVLQFSVILSAHRVTTPIPIWTLANLVRSGSEVKNLLAAYMFSPSLFLRVLMILSYVLRGSLLDWMLLI